MDAKICDKCKKVVSENELYELPLKAERIRQYEVHDDNIHVLKFKIGEICESCLEKLRILIKNFMEVKE